jgi:hypothetical protein
MDGARLLLNRIRDTNEYLLSVDSDHIYVLDYVTVTTPPGMDKDYISIDPSGGPLLHVGCEVSDGVKLTRIFRDDEMTKFVLECYYGDK